jgi:hypothetical protein
MILSSVDIPIADDTFYQVQVFFDEEKYNLRFHWNSRCDTWYADLLTVDNDPILYGLACLTNVPPMFGRFALTSTPKTGDMIILDVNGLGKDPTFEDFGDKTGPFYLSVADDIS